MKMRRKGSFSNVRLVFSFSHHCKFKPFGPFSRLCHTKNWKSSSAIGIFFENFKSLNKKNQWGIMKIIISSSHIINAFYQLLKIEKMECKSFICSLRSLTGYFSRLWSNLMVITVGIIINHRSTNMLLKRLNVM